MIGTEPTFNTFRFGLLFSSLACKFRSKQFFSMWTLQITVFLLNSTLTQSAWLLLVYSVIIWQITTTLHWIGDLEKKLPRRFTDLIFTCKNLTVRCDFVISPSISHACLCTRSLKKGDCAFYSIEKLACVDCFKNQVCYVTSGIIIRRCSLVSK